MFAYYKPNGEHMALTRNIESNQLPINLSAALKDKFDEYWLTDLFEVSAEEENAYYATISNATHVVVLKSQGTNGWVVFKKEKRK